MLVSTRRPRPAGLDLFRGAVFAALTPRWDANGVRRLDRRAILLAAVAVLPTTPR